MPSFTPSAIHITPETLNLLEAISRKQGELSAHRSSLVTIEEVANLATIDAVHFSTKIEGNALTRDQVTQALHATPPIKATTRDLREVLNYSRTRRQVRDWALKGKLFHDQWVLTHHAELLKGIVRGKLAGHYREAQCVISDSRSREIIYMAPVGGDVPGFMKGLLTWLRNQKLSRASPLLLAAQFHFEFVTIHPFMDGNGRLARLLTNGILLAGGHDVERFAALEKQHEKNRARYYGALRSLQRANYYDIPVGQDIGAWISYWLQCVLATYDEALERLCTVNADKSTAGLDDKRLQKAEAIFKRHQRLRAGEYADLMGLGRTQAVADLNRLSKAGVIARIGGGRSIVYKIK